MEVEMTVHGHYSPHKNTSSRKWLKRCMGPHLMHPWERHPVQGCHYSSSQPACKLVGSTSSEHLQMLLSEDALLLPPMTKADPLPSPAPSPSTFLLHPAPYPHPAPSPCPLLYPRPLALSCLTYPQLTASLLPLFQLLPPHLTLPLHFTPAVINASLTGHNG